jgi:biopolymer transport protein ExbD/biopolymer transport protein TolR
MAGPSFSLRKSRPRGDLRADINVTPLVDVVLVLLIIFMVVVPMVAQSVPVELPLARHHDRKADDGKDMVVSVTREGQVYLRTDRVDVRDVPRLLEEQRRRSSQGKVYLKGDGLTRYRAVREVVDALRRANLDEVMLATEEAKAQP